MTRKGMTDERYGEQQAAVAAGWDFSDPTHLTKRRLRKLAVFMECAKKLGCLTTCKRGEVGALLVPSDFSEMLAIGYNGPLAGMPDDACPGHEDCGCTHAEANCLIKPRRYEAGRRRLVMLVSRAPCPQCASLIVNSKAVGLVAYSRKSTPGEHGLRLLSWAGVDTMYLVTSGASVEWLELNGKVESGQ